MDRILTQVQNYKEFEVLADYKCAFGKIAINALNCLSNNDNTDLYKTILKSHRYFYTDFQILDDINDYTDDVKNGQFNISKQELINSLVEKNKAIEYYSLGEQKNNLH